MKWGIILCSVILLIVILSSCSEDSNPTNSDVYIPQIENQWRDEQDANHTFQLSSNDEGLNHGLFDGFENYPDQNIFDVELHGSFTNRNIEFNLERDGTIKYTGKFTQDNRIELTSSKGNLVLIHD